MGWWCHHHFAEPEKTGVERQLPQLNSHGQITIYCNSGVIILPTQTMHYYRGIPQNYHTFVLFDPPRNGNLMTPVIPKPEFSGDLEVDSLTKPPFWG